MTNNIQEKYSKEINQLEEWTEIKYKEVIFDSDIHDWSQYSSEFGERLMNKSNIII